MNKFFRCFCVCGMLFFQQAFSQATLSDPVDGQGWYTAAFKHQVLKKLKYEVQYQARFNNNLKSYFGSYLSLGTQYRIVKNLDLLFEYRHSWLQNSQYRRFSGGFQYGYDYRKWDFGLRALVLNQVQDYDDPTKAEDHKGYYRFRVSAARKLSKKLEIYSSVEPIFRIGGNFLVDNWRDIIGVKYKPTKNWRFEAYYLYRPDYGKATYNRYYHILGLGVEYFLNSTVKVLKCAGPTRTIAPN